MPNHIALKSNEKEIIIKIVANQAVNAPFQIGPRGYLMNLIDKSNLPNNFKMSRKGDIRGVADFDSRNLINWAINQGINPVNKRYTVLGSLLVVLIEDLGLEDRLQIAAIIGARRLFLDQNILSSFFMRYQIPQALDDFEEGPTDYGPDFKWEGSTEQVDLQGFLRPEPDFQDVGFLKQGIKRATSVCRIEIPREKPVGTGFLIAENLLLTNYHVFVEMQNHDLMKRAHETVLRFGNITAADGEESDGQEFVLDKKHPLLKYSPKDKLDYVLLRVEDKITQIQGVEPAPFTSELPYKGMDLNILQHPEGKALQLALSGDGVDKVFPERGIVQYSTRTKSGSSGSPCFTDNWEVIALHQSERPRPMGSIRQGIIFISIYEEIKDYF